MSPINFKKVYFKLSLSFMLSATLTSCSLLPNDNQKTKIRVVDVDGNPKEIKRYVPALNAEALAKQGYKVNVENGELEALNSNPSNNASNQKTAEINVPVTSINNNLAEITPNPTSGLLQNEQSQKEQGQKQTIIFQTNKNKIPEQKSNTDSQAIEYDLSGTGPVVESKTSEPIVGKIPEEKPKKKFNILIEKATDSKLKHKTESKIEKSASKGLFIQIGSFTSAEIANNTLTKNQNIHKGKIEEAMINNKKTYRVLLGPIKDQNEADKILSKVVNSGSSDAFITKNKR